MAPSQNTIPSTTKQNAVTEYTSGTPIKDVAAKYNVSPSSIYRWARDPAYNPTAASAPGSSGAPAGSGAPAAGSGSAPKYPKLHSAAQRYAANPGMYGKFIRVSNIYMRGLLIAAVRIAWTVLIAIGLWLLLEVDGEALEERRQKWMVMNNKLGALSDALKNGVAPLRPDAVWNTDDKVQFIAYIESFTAEVDQLAAAAKTNADAIDTVLKGLTVLLTTVLSVVSTIVAIIYILAPLLFTPAAPEAKAQVELLGVKINASIGQLIASAVGLMNLAMPLLTFYLSRRAFVGAQPNPRGPEGTTFGAMKIQWKLSKTH